MRDKVNNQAETGKTIEFKSLAIKDIKFDPRSRDEVTKLLRALQDFYIDDDTREKIFLCLGNMISAKVDMTKGRKGFSLWSIFVLGMLRLICRWNYDKLKDQADNHRKIREMMGVNNFFDEDKVFALTTIHDNVDLFTKDIANSIGEIIVNHAHKNITKTGNDDLFCLCDSFVYKSNVHFPTDYNLLLDTYRTVVKLCASGARKSGIGGWREFNSYLKKFKRSYNQLSKMRYSNSKNDQRKLERSEEIKSVVKAYLEDASRIFIKARCLIADLDTSDWERFNIELTQYLDYGNIFIDQITRRVIHDEVIPSGEKRYSIFEPYTEWISKGKAGVPVEFGVRFCVLQDQYGFILHHKLMNGQQDVDVAVEMVEEAQKKFPNIISVSFDKGFHAKKNEDGLGNIQLIEKLGVEAIIPKKGRRNKEEKELESSEVFGNARRQHPAIESGIHSLQCHGLARCPDRGDERFDKYAAMGVLAHNIHNFGAILIKKDLEQLLKNTA